MQQVCQEWLQQDLVMPSIRESEKFKQAINQGLTLHEMGQKDLAYPIELLAEKMSKLKFSLT
jgi:chromosome partitioning protein